MRYIDADSISDDTPVSDLPVQIVGMATEMNSTTERPVTFDTKFVAKKPKLSTSEVMIRLHIIWTFRISFILRILMGRLISLRTEHCIMW